MDAAGVANAYLDTAKQLYIIDDVRNEFEYSKTINNKTRGLVNGKRIHKKGFATDD